MADDREIATRIQALLAEEERLSERQNAEGLDEDERQWKGQVSAMLDDCSSLLQQRRGEGNAASTPS